MGNNRAGAIICSGADWNLFPVLVGNDIAIPPKAKATFISLHALCGQHRRNMVVSKECARKITGGRTDKTFRNHISILRSFNLICSGKTRNGTLIEFYSPWLRYTRMTNKQSVTFVGNEWINTDLALSMHIAGISVDQLKKKFNFKSEYVNAKAFMKNLTGYVEKKAEEAMLESLETKGFAHWPSRCYPGVFDVVMYRGPRKRIWRSNSYITQDADVVYDPTTKTLKSLKLPQSEEIPTEVSSHVGINPGAELDGKSYDTGYVFGTIGGREEVWDAIRDTYGEDAETSMRQDLSAKMNTISPLRPSCAVFDEEVTTNDVYDLSKGITMYEHARSVVNDFCAKTASATEANAPVQVSNTNDPTGASTIDQTGVFTPTELVQKFPILMYSFSLNCSSINNNTLLRRMSLLKPRIEISLRSISGVPQRLQQRQQKQQEQLRTAELEAIQALTGYEKIAALELYLSKKPIVQKRALKVKALLSLKQQFKSPLPTKEHFRRNKGNMAALKAQFDPLGTCSFVNPRFSNEASIVKSYWTVTCGLPPEGHNANRVCDNILSGPTEVLTGEEVVVKLEDTGTISRHTIAPSGVETAHVCKALDAETKSLDASQPWFVTGFTSAMPQKSTDTSQGATSLSGDVRGQVYVLGSTPHGLLRDFPEANSLMHRYRASMKDFRHYPACILESLKAHNDYDISMDQD